MRTSNPVLNDKVFQDLPVTAEKNMTVNGAVLKTIVLLGLVVLAAAFTWQRFYALGPAAVMPLMIGGSVGGLVLALVTSFKKE